MKRFFTLVATALCMLTANAQYGQYVGGDISLITAYDEHNSGYLDENGNKISDLVSWLKNDCGWNSFRVRLFVNPTNANGDGVIQDIDYVKTLGKRIKDAGANFMLDFHYSDTWVDATHIQAPSACSSMTADEKASWIYTYTKESLQTLNDAGATPDLIQVGNEIMYGFMGITVHPYASSSDDWSSYLKVLGQACKAVRETCPQAKIIVHTDRPTNTSYNKFYYDKLVNGGIDFDVIGLSYYPIWHGWLTTSQSATNLSAALTQLASDYPTKKVQIVETAYNFQWWPSDGVNTNTQGTWACSVDGQYNFVKDLIKELNTHSNVDGLFYWFPEEAGCGDDTNWSSSKYGTVITSWLNRGLWKEDYSSTGHSMNVATDGSSVAKIMKNFLSSTSAINNTEINPVIKDNKIYNLSGKVVNENYKGIVIKGGKKTLQ